MARTNAQAATGLHLLENAEDLAAPAQDAAAPRCVARPPCTAHARMVALRNVSLILAVPFYTVR